MSNPKTFRPWLPEQAWLLPPSPIDWLPKDHLVFFLLDLIDQLDLDPILQLYRQKDARGEKAYEPRMMVVLLLYTYCVGMPSSRKIERACYEVLPFRVLSGNQQPDHTRIREFRRRNRERREVQAPVAPSGRPSARRCCAPSAGVLSKIATPLRRCLGPPNTGSAMSSSAVFGSARASTWAATRGSIQPSGD
jgi:hypothetical protein